MCTVKKLWEKRQSPMPMSVHRLLIDQEYNPAVKNSIAYWNVDEGGGVFLNARCDDSTITSGKITTFSKIVGFGYWSDIKPLL